MKSLSVSSLNYVDLVTAERDELVDIREISVDKDLPKEERIAAFIRQIKNPYRFRCGEFVVNACFASMHHRKRLFPVWAKQH